MSKTETHLDRVPADSTIDDPKGEVDEYRRLKPLIKLCLKLNHDINNPLTGIIGNAEFMLTDKIKLTADQRLSLEQIIECGERIQERMGRIGEIKSTLDKPNGTEDVVPAKLSPIS